MGQAYTATETPSSSQRSHQNLRARLQRAIRKKSKSDGFALGWSEMRVPSQLGSINGIATAFSCFGQFEQSLWNWERYVAFLETERFKPEGPV
jgi:hypothetical protein